MDICEKFRTSFDPLLCADMEEKKKQTHLLCILSGENTNTTIKISLVVFFYRWSISKASL